MKVIPINYYDYKYRNNMRNNCTKPAQNISFGGLFSPKSLQNKFDAGIAALDKYSVLIFTEEKKQRYAKFYFNDRIDKIDIPINKIYTLIATKQELPISEISTSFAIWKNNDNKYYIMDLNGTIGIRAGKDIKSYDKSKFENGEVKEIQRGDKILLYDNWDKPVTFNFTPTDKIIYSEAKECLKVENRFEEQKSIVDYNKALISKLYQEKATTNNSKEYTFADIGGLEKQKEELRKYVLRPLNYPDVYKNIRLNKGILLYGPPRCGKTILGEALANEADIEFLCLNANEFISGTLGSSEKNIRQVFDEILSKPAILFIDEFDAIGKIREGTPQARYDDSVVNQLLGCMSDLEKSYTNSFVIAATNRKDLLDNALLASGRFGLHLEIPMPDMNALSEIYDIHSKDKQFETVYKDFVVEEMYKNNFNGSDVAEMFMLAYFNSLERLGMNKAMDAKLFRFEDIEKIKISTDDLMNAIEKISAQK